MRPCIVLIAGALASCAPSLGQSPDAKSAYVERMSGFDQILEEAVIVEEVDLALVSPGEESDFRVSKMPRFRSEAARLLHEKVTGRSRENMVLELWDTRTKKTVVSYGFNMQPTKAEQMRAARTFARMVRNKLSEEKQAN